MVEGELRELNRQAIVDGLMLPEAEYKDRKLGRNLTPREEYCYRVIHTASLERRRVSAKDLYKAIYGSLPVDEVDISAVISTKVARMKSKLGMSSIMSDRNGYVSRSALIELQSKKWSYTK